MKKLVSLLLVAVMLSASFLTIPVMAETATDYFAVNFDTTLNEFTVTATSALAGTNRVLVLVQDGSETIYMDSLNDVTAQEVYFGIDLGNALEAKEYSFIVSSYGDTVTSQTLTCTPELSDDTEVPDWFTVEYDSTENAFMVKSVADNYTGTNRVILYVYEPAFNGYQEIWYMDAINAASGSFSFKVPVPEVAPIGKYTFRVATYGDMVTDGIISYEYSQNFTSYTEQVAESTDIKMGGKYILNDGEEGAAIYVALYKKGKNDEVPQLVRATYSDEVSTAESVNYIQTDLTLTEAEQTSDYYVRVFAWKQATLYPLASSITINQE